MHLESSVSAIPVFSQSWGGRFNNSFLSFLQKVLVHISFPTFQPAFEDDDHGGVTSVKRAIAPSEHFQKVQFLRPACFCKSGLHFLLENNVDEIIIVVPHLVLDPVTLNPVHQQSFLFPGKENKMRRLVQSK